MKKLLYSILIVFILIPMLILPSDIEAQTLGGLKSELDLLEAKYREQENEEHITEGKIENVNQTIEQIEKNIVKMEEDVKRINAEIAALDEKIKLKDKEMKKVINFVQVSSGESAYLEYAFGAKNFTDFIYRISISEQLTKYNEKMIKDYEKMISDNKKKQEELANKSIELAAEKVKLNVELAKLGDKLASIASLKVSVNDEIALQREAIKTLENMGCKDNEDIKTCGRDTLPSDTAFLRPIVEGEVRSEYGYRCLEITGCTLHEGIDLGAMYKGTVPIYSSANGTVIGIRERSSCGGNMVFILHQVNGKKYTTMYAHLRDIMVVPGQRVTKNTQIATMGGDPNIEWWDGCSTGQHLHFTIASGHYLKDYYNWSTFISNTYDPRESINFPLTGNSTDYFADRITRY